VIEAIAGGVQLTVRVIPRAAKSATAGIRDGALVVRLNAPPVDGAANEALITLLSSALGISRRQITIVAGSHNRNKRLHISGVDAAKVATALAPAT
jgi:uncharacterized protein (TIGR00251 family)